MPRPTPTTPFYYIMSDATKAHVDPTTLPIGAVLIYVALNGREIPFVNSRPEVKTEVELISAMHASRRYSHGE